MRRIIQLLTLGCLATLAFAADKPEPPAETPKSANALSAIRKHDIGIEQARQTLTAEGIVLGAWGVGKHGNLKSSGESPISVADAKYKHALAFNATDNASSVLTFTLDRHYKRLTGASGLNDTAKGYSVTLNYRIVGDGHELWKSEPPKVEIGTLYRYDVDVSNVKTLQLIAECAGGAAGAHVVWLEPELFRK